MKRRTANCPACGGLVEFKTGSAAVVICDYCSSVIARGDKGLEEYGRVADVGETSSGLHLGASGRYGHKEFHISGRVRYRHPAGGFWDEWYLTFPGEKWGWLAEAQGNFYLLAERTIARPEKFPSFEQLEMGERIGAWSTELSVRERGVALAESAEGEIPWAFRPGAEHRFVDLTGPDKAFATIEFGDQPRAFVGRQVSLAELNIREDGALADPRAAQIRVAALQVNCPKCGGTLALRAPDQTLRVTCPHCNSLLDAQQGKLQYLSTLARRRVTPVIPLGAEGEIRGNRYTVIGFMERYVRYQGTNFPWTEYLLYNREIGFRWLVCNDDHWSFVEPVEIPITVFGVRERIPYDGVDFRIYDRGTAHVSHVIGEFYWRVKVGEKVWTSDFIAPPRMLSFERSRTGSSEEINISLGTYLAPEEVERGFGVQGLKRPWGVGVIQPRPQTGSWIYALWFLFLVALWLTHSQYSDRPMGGSDPWLLFYAMVFVSLIPAGVLLYLYSFEVKRWQNSDFSPYASSDD